jgi:hypothetical protein
MGSPQTDSARFVVSFLGVTSDASMSATYERGRLVVSLQWPEATIDWDALELAAEAFRRFPRLHEIVLVGAKLDDGALATVTFRRVGASAAWVVVSY